MDNLTLPGGSTIPNTPGLNSNFTNLGSIASAFLSLAIELGFVLMFIWLVIGAIQFFLSAGNKELVAHARKRIISAIIGFIILAVALLLQQFVQTFLPIQNVNVTNVSSLNIHFVTPARADNGVPLNRQFAFGNLTSLGGALSFLIPIIFQLAAVVLVFFLLFGAVRWIMSGGEKEAIAGARRMITTAVIGFVLLMIIFVVVEAIPQLLGFKNLDLFK